MKQALACFFLSYSMTESDKLLFLRNRFIPLLYPLKAADTGRWGKMNAQQMVEHLTGFFRVSTGDIRMPVVSNEEHLPKLRAFLQSDKPFRENTKAPVLPEEPLPVRNAGMQEALEELSNAVDAFFALFENDPDLTTTHPVFGVLNGDEWILLHYKHVTHHLRQFGLITEGNT